MLRERIRQAIERFVSPAIRELEQRNAELCALLEQRWKDVRLLNIQPCEKGFELSLRTELGSVLAHWMYETLRASEAVNYVEITATHPEGQQYLFSIQRKRGETPAVQAARYRKLLNETQEAQPLDDWHEDIGPVLWWRFPVVEPPYVGTPLDYGFNVARKGRKPRWVGGWPGHHTHWTRLPHVPPVPASARSRELAKIIGDGA
jgi:hypothetical protein